MLSLVLDIVASELKIDRSKVTAETNQENTPEWDSLGHLKLVLELERQLGIRFRGDDIPTMTSVARIVDVVENTTTARPR